MSNHARLSPSAASRWLACPASVNMTAELEDTTSAAAAEGTLAHTVVENRIRSHLDGSPFALKPEYTPEMMDGANLTLDYVKDIIEQYHDVAVYLEEKVDTH